MKAIVPPILVALIDSFSVPTPPDETFAYLADLEHEVRWNPWAIEVAQITPGPICEGSRFRHRDETAVNPDHDDERDDHDPLAECLVADREDDCGLHDHDREEHLIRREEPRLRVLSSMPRGKWSRLSTTAAATTGPANGAQPASSTPATGSGCTFSSLKQGRAMAAA